MPDTYGGEVVSRDAVLITNQASLQMVGNLKVDPVASINTILIRLGHESLDVTLAYLKGKDAESEEAEEHANSSGLALDA